MNKEQLLTKLNGFTTEFPNAQLPVSDVIKLVSELQESSIDLEKLKDNLQGKIRTLLEETENDHDFVDYDSAEFSIGYDNKITLDCISFNMEDVIVGVEGIIEVAFEDVK
jgi:hypothetical protein